MSDHARLSPSSAHRWMRCPGSVAAESGYADDANEWAAEGTVFHEVVADCLELGLQPHDFVGQVRTRDGFDIEITQDMASFAVPGLDVLNEVPGELVIEHRADLGAWLPEQFGTLDVGIVTPEWIGIWDWKYGQGVPVSPERNEQLMLYALGFWDNIARHKTNAKDFRLFVEQPRISGAGGEWRCTLDDLLRFGERAVAAAAETYQEQPALRAGEKACLFCKARPDCQEFWRFNLDLMAAKFGDMADEPEEPQAEFEPPATSAITPERRAYVARHAGMFRKWLDDVHARVLHDALSGEPTPGLKAVPGRAGPRQWSDREAAERLVTRAVGVRKAFEKKLLSPTQAEKVLSTAQWKKATALIGRSDPKPVLVDENDKREAIRPVVDAFDDETADAADQLI